MNIPKYENWFQHFSYTKLYRFPAWIFRKVLFLNVDFKKKVLIPMRIGHKIELRATQPYLQRILINQVYGDESVFYLKQFLKKDAVIIDIGANIGLLTCAYAQRYQHLSPTIYAIEAVEQNFLQLVKNLELNNFHNVKPFRLALGKEKGEVIFNLPSKEFMGNAVGSNVLTDADEKKLGIASTYKEVVPLMTLDAWAAENKISRCDFIKLDIEGAELAVFLGGQNFIKKFRPLIQCEFNRYYVEQQGLKIQDYVTFFKTLQYECYVDEKSHFRPIDVTQFHHTLVDLLFKPLS